MDFIPGIGATAGGLDAQRTRLEVIAQNLAEHTTKTVDGAPYQRQVVNFAEALDATGNSSVRVESVTRDLSPGGARFDPRIRMRTRRDLFKCRMYHFRMRWWIC